MRVSPEDIRDDMWRETVDAAGREKKLARTLTEGPYIW